MRDIIVDFKKDLPLLDIEQVLQDLGWIKFDPEHPKKKHDYYGLGKAVGETEVTITINEKRKTEKDAKRVVDFCHYKPFPKVAYDEFTFQSTYDKAKTINQKLDVLAEYMGLKKRMIGDWKSIYIGKKKLTDLEKIQLRRSLNNSLGIPIRTILNDRKLEIWIFQNIPDDWKKMIPNLVNIWLKPKEEIEANFDYDVIDKQTLYDKYLYPMAEEFGMENIQIRTSANPKNHHARIINKLFKPKESLRIRKKHGDSPQRVKADEKQFKHKLRCNFLYDIKNGKPAGRWTMLKDWIRENKIVI